MFESSSAPPVEAPAKTVAIVQSNYIPWKGYFDLINRVDEFILYDDRQYTKRDWRNRNRIKSAGGTIWLTIPVSVRGRFLQRIDETEIVDAGWAARHWRTITQSYSRAPYFESYRPHLEEIYLSRLPNLLSQVNRRLLEALCEMLGITTSLSWSTDYAGISGSKTERLLQLCQAARATRYISGPSARSYLDSAVFEQVGIELVYFDYIGYPAYPQLHPPFEHTVSVLDLLFHTGRESYKYMLSFGTGNDPS